MIKRANMNNVVANTNVIVCYSDYETKAKFLGFTKVDEKYSDTPHFKTLKEAKQHYGVRTNKQLEDYDVGLGYGHTVYGVFLSADNKGKVYKWCAYLFEGKWCACSSAHPIRLIPA
jgi:hypothetical protein